MPELSPPDSLSRLLPVTPPKGLGAFGLRGLTLKSLLLQRVNNVQGGSLLTFPSWGCREEFTTFPPHTHTGLLPRLPRQLWWERACYVNPFPLSLSTQWFMQHEVVLRLCHKIPPRLIQTGAQPGAAAMPRGLQSCASGRGRPLTALPTGVKHGPRIGDSRIINRYSFIPYF